MKAVRLAALLALGLSAACVVRAADRTGPAPDDIIFPRATEAEATSDGAAPGPGSSSVFAPGPRPATGGLMSAAGYITAFALLIGAGWFLLKRGALPRPFAKNDSSKLRVLETRGLGNRQFLVVVEYDDAKLLLGVCPGRIDYLTPLAGHPLATGANGVTVGDDDDESPAVPFSIKGDRL